MNSRFSLYNIAEPTPAVLGGLRELDLIFDAMVTLAVRAGYEPDETDDHAIYNHKREMEHLKQKLLGVN